LRQRRALLAVQAQAVDRIAQLLAHALERRLPVGTPIHIV
jgi:hypothetical protein